MPTSRWAAATCALALIASPAFTAPATPQTEAVQRAAAASPSFQDNSDVEAAGRGFLGTRADPVIRNASGAPVYSLAAYEFLKGPAPATVNPALWRESGLLAKHGLFQVTEGVYQVRGFDLANATFVRGKTGWIVIDTLSSAETAKAAYDLVTEKLGARPIVAVIYTHSHSDHFAGAGGLITAADAASGKVRVIAPEGFMEEVAAENITAGPAMSRRAIYQFGIALPRGPEGQVGAGIGPGLSRGITALIPPNTLVAPATKFLVVDGVRIEFQLTPNTEAPAEMNLYLPAFRALCMAENANVTMHNVLTPRGALVRDSKVWADGLTDAIGRFGGRSDVMFTSHGWPRFGRPALTEFLGRHRDAYKFVHDQSVRLMNQGLTGEEIAANLKLPPALAREWYNHGFYGTVSFNARAVYQRYMGWYDANPVHLAAMEPVERARRYVAAMGGREAVARLAAEAQAAGDYAWAAELGDKLVFADPKDAAARTRLAEAYEQLGYQAESSLWRNMYLTAVGELKNGPVGAPAGGALAGGATLPLLLDATAVRLNPEKSLAGKATVAIVLADSPERAWIRVENSVLVHQAGAPSEPVQATLTLTRADLGALLAGGPADLDAKLKAGAVKVAGDASAASRLLGWLDPPAAAPFPIVTP